MLQDIAGLSMVRPLSMKTASIHDSPEIENIRPKPILKIKFSPAQDKENQPPNILFRQSSEKRHISNKGLSNRAANKSISVEEKQEIHSVSIEERKSQHSVDTLSEYLGLGKKKEENKNDFNQSGYVLVPRDVDESAITSKCMNFCEDLSHLSMKIDQCSVYSVKSLKTIKTFITPRSKSRETKRENKSIDVKKSEKSKQKSRSSSLKEVIHKEEPQIVQEVKLTNQQIIEKTTRLFLQISEMLTTKSKSEYQLGKVIRLLFEKHQLHSEKLAVVHKKLALVLRESAKMMTVNEFYLQTAVVGWANEERSKTRQTRPARRRDQPAGVQEPEDAGRRIRPFAV